MPDFSDPDAGDPDAGDPAPIERPSRSRQRWLIRGVGVAVVLALIAAGLVIGHAKWQDHQRAAAHQRLLDRQQVYLDAVRRLDARLTRDLAPTRQVLRALGKPRAGDLFAARDAFATTENVAAINRDLDALKGLHAPVGWDGYADHLRKAVEEMRDALTGMHDDRDSVNQRFLANDLQSTQGGVLASGLVDWQSAVASLFHARRQKAPGGMAADDALRTPPALTSWVFGMDRACIANELRTHDLHPTGSTTQDAINLRAASTSLARLVSDLRRVPVPRRHAAAIRRDVLEPLTAVAQEAALLRQEADDVERLDVEGVQQTVDRLRTLIGRLPLLARGFRKYHAVACGGAAGSGRDRHLAA